MIVRRTFALGVGSLLLFPVSAAAQKKEGARDKEKTEVAERAERAVKQLVQAVRDGRDQDAVRVMSDLRAKDAEYSGARR